MADSHRQGTKGNRSRYWIGILSASILSILWLGGCVAYLTVSFGWPTLQLLLPHELAMILAGLLVPLCLLWLLVLVFRGNKTRPAATAAVDLIPDPMMEQRLAADRAALTVLAEAQRALGLQLQQTSDTIISLAKNSDDAASRWSSWSQSLTRAEQALSTIDQRMAAMAQPAIDHVADLQQAQEKFESSWARLARDVEHRIADLTRALNDSQARGIDTGESIVGQLTAQMEKAIAGAEAQLAAHRDHWAGLSDSIAAALTAQTQAMAQRADQSVTLLNDAARQADRQWTDHEGQISERLRRIDELTAHFAGSLSNQIDHQEAWRNRASLVETLWSEVTHNLDQGRAEFLGQLQQMAERLQQDLDEVLTALTGRLAAQVSDLSKRGEGHVATLGAGQEEFARALIDQRDEFAQALERHMAELIKITQQAGARFAAVPDPVVGPRDPLSASGTGTETTLPVTPGVDQAAAFAPAAWMALRRLRALADDRAQSFDADPVLDLVRTLDETVDGMAGDWVRRAPAMAQLLSHGATEIDAIADHLLAQASAIHEAAARIAPAWRDQRGGQDQADINPDGPLHELDRQVGVLQQALRSAAVGSVQLAQALRGQSVALTRDAAFPARPGDSASAIQAEKIEWMHDRLVSIDERVQHYRRHQTSTREIVQRMDHWADALPGWLQEPSELLGRIIADLRAAGPDAALARLPALQSRLSALGSVLQSRLQNLRNIAHRAQGQLDELAAELNRIAEESNRDAVKAALRVGDLSSNPGSGAGASARPGTGYEAAE